MTQRRIPANIKDRVVELYRAGWGSYRIQREMGVSAPTALRIVRQAGVPVRHRHPPYRRIDAKIRDEVVRLYEQGFPRLRIARQFGLSEGGVTSILNRKHPRPRKTVDFNSLPVEVRIPPHLRKTLVELYNQGLGINHIGARLGLNSKTIREALRVEDASQIRVLYEKGTPTAVIASTLGLSHGMVEYIIRKQGIHRTHRGAGWFLSDDLRGRDRRSNRMVPKGSGRGNKTKLPVATVAYYGPDDKVSTKVAVGIIEQLGREPSELKRWAGNDVANDPQIVKEVTDFIRRHGAKSVVVTDGNMGCPHEEGIDFPEGKDCPYCPFWRGKQGTARGKASQVKTSENG